MKSKISKSGAKKEIKEFFLEIKKKTAKPTQARPSSSESQAKEIKKIKRLAMKQNIPLKEKRKLFCKKCLVAYENPRVRIKNKVKSVTCLSCGYVSRWKL